MEPASKSSYLKLRLNGFGFVIKSLGDGDDLISFFFLLMTNICHHGNAGSAMPPVRVMLNFYLYYEACGI